MRAQTYPTILGMSYLGSGMHSTGAILALDIIHNVRSNAGSDLIRLSLSELLIQCPGTQHSAG